MSTRTFGDGLLLWPVNDVPHGVHIPPPIRQRNLQSREHLHIAGLANDARIEGRNDPAVGPSATQWDLYHEEK